ncbi:MAG: biopolymer transporter ExbD [Proteobacteria bacterium]|nr:biopolymer transporter ExbD [Pseudomonadota bacterium]
MQLPLQKHEEESDPILPLINVVFLLLIFFIMTGALHSVDYFNVDPPSSSSEVQASLDEMVILVGGDGRLAIDNREVDEVDLQLSISDKLAANAGAVFRIKADGRVDAARVVELMEMIEAVGVRRVMLLTLEPEG